DQIAGVRKEPPDRGRSFTDRKSARVHAAGALAALHAVAADLSEEAAVLTRMRSRPRRQALARPAVGSLRTAALADIPALGAVEHPVDDAHDALNVWLTTQVDPAAVLALVPTVLALGPGVIGAAGADGGALLVVVAA